MDLNGVTLLHFHPKLVVFCIANLVLLHLIDGSTLLDGQIHWVSGTYVPIELYKQHNETISSWTVREPPSWWDHLVMVLNNVKFGYKYNLPMWSIDELYSCGNYMEYCCLNNLFNYFLSNNNWIYTMFCREVMDQMSVTLILCFVTLFGKCKFL